MPIMLPPMPHQESGAVFLAARGFALIADEPGAAKTRQVIMAADMINAKRILVLPPAKVKNSWAEEIERWSVRSLPITVIDGKPKLTPQGEGWFIGSNALMAYDDAVYVLKAGKPYDIIVADELRDFHEYQSKRTYNLLAPADGLWRHCDRFWALDGSPLVNSAADFFPLVYGPMTRGAGAFTWHQFSSYFAHMIPDAYSGHKPVGLQRGAELAAMLRPHMLRRTLDSVGIKLPPMTVNRVPMALEPGALVRAMAGLDGWTSDRVALALDTQDQIRDAAMSRVRHALGIAKVEAVTNRIEQLIGLGFGPLIVFYHHTLVQKLIRDELRFRGIDSQIIDGDTSRTALKNTKANFQAGNIPVCLIQTQAGGMGLTLTRSNYALNAELPWTAAALTQAGKRIHRVGQERPCGIEILHAAGCWLEDVLASVVSRKQRAADELLAMLTTSN